MYYYGIEPQQVAQPMEGDQAESAAYGGAKEDDKDGESDEDADAFAKVEAAKVAAYNAELQAELASISLFATLNAEKLGTLQGEGECEMYMAIAQQAATRARAAEARHFEERVAFEKRNDPPDEWLYDADESDFEDEEITWNEESDSEERPEEEEEQEDEEYQEEVEEEEESATQAGQFPLQDPPIEPHYMQPLLCPYLDSAQREWINEFVYGADNRSAENIYRGAVSRFPNDFGPEHGMPHIPGCPTSSSPNLVSIKLSFIMQLYHATACRWKNPVLCPFESCGMLRQVYNHLKTCQVPVNSEKRCWWLACENKKNIARHFTRCKREDCDLCVPVRKLTKYDLRRIAVDPYTFSVPC